MCLRESYILLTNIMSPNFWSKKKKIILVLLKIPPFITMFMFIMFQAALILHVSDALGGVNNETRSMYSPCEKNCNLCMKSMICLIV
jgi:hypothetical protein